MKLKVAFIDCFIQSPVNESVNRITQKNQLITSYHMPSMYGISSLEKDQDVDAYVILGSASHVYQKLKWHKELLEFIIPKIESNIPVLGICFGHQLIADYYGCKIDYINQEKEVLKVKRKLNFSKSFGEIEKHDSLTLVYEHAQYISELSDRFDCIASSEQFKYEVLKLKNHPYFSLQAHPECSNEFIQNNITDDNEQVSKILNDGALFISSFLKMAKQYR